MEKTKKLPSLRRMFLRLMLFRLFLPLVVLGSLTITGVSYLGAKDLTIQQYQISQSMANMVDFHLDHGVQIMDSLAMVAENFEVQDLSIFMESTQKASKYFETLYYLDKDNKIKLMMPSDSRYSGLDMSKLPDFQQIGVEKKLIISRPFISIRTGEPTVYLIRPLSRSGYIVAELKLGLFQQEITNIKTKSGKDFVFIMDQFGTLLAHPSLDLVKQQTNLSNLEIFRHGLNGNTNAIYQYNGISVLGSVVKIERTGWIVVDQVPLSVFFNSYAWTLALILLTSLAIWLTLVFNLRKQLQRYMITPLEQLSQAANTLTVGDFSQINSLASIPATFAELDILVTDFQIMSDNLQIRETALQQAKAELELQVEQRTQELVSLNKELQKLSSMDGLTGIGNRRYLDEFLEQEWQRGIQNQIPLALIMLDIDFFKDYNDLYGHQAGDDCLKQVANALKVSLNSGDYLIARYGGEEFVVVLTDTDINSAAFLAEYLRARIEALGIKHEKSSISKFVTVSLGIAALVPQQASQHSVIISAADQALYKAKRNGRNQVKIAESI